MNESSIEQAIFKSLLFNEEYTRKVLPYLDESYFDDYYKTFFSVYKELFDKYNSVPTLEALGVTFSQLDVGENDFGNIVNLLEYSYETKDDLPDTQWLIDETESYCKDKKIYQAIYESINIIEGSNTKLDKHAIPEMLDEALSISFDQTIGMDFFDDAGARFEHYTAEDNRIKYPLDVLNKISNGGHKRKALSCALAATNVGKSALMCFLSAEFMKMGHNVLYLSMEMAEEDVYQRIDANMLKTSTDSIIKMTKSDYVDKIDKIKNKTNGKLVVKEYPTGSAHVGHFRHLIKELQQKKKFKPDIIFIDYINICASSRYRSMSGVNSYTYIKAIAEEIRGLAMEMDLAIMTATQTNRGSSSDSESNNVDMTSTSDCLDPNSIISERNRGEIKLKDIKVGDQVLSHDGYKTVRVVHHPKTKRAYKIKLKSGKTVICSADHKIPTKRGRICINDGLTIGDKVSSY